MTHQFLQIHWRKHPIGLPHDLVCQLLEPRWQKLAEYIMQTSFPLQPTPSTLQAATGKQPTYSRTIHTPVILSSLFSPPLPSRRTKDTEDTKV